MGDVQIQIRNVVADDLSAIIHLLADDEIGARREDTGRASAAGYDAAFEAVMDDPRSDLIVAVIDESIVGCLQLAINPGLSYRGARRCQIEDVRVARDRRNTGVGSMLMAEAESRACQKGCELAQLMVHQNRMDAARFYQRCGFETAHLGLRKTIPPG